MMVVSLVEVVEQTNRLDDHGVHLIWAELELMSRQRVGETNLCGRRISFKREPQHMYGETESSAECQ